MKRVSGGRESNLEKEQRGKHGRDISGRWFPNQLPWLARWGWGFSEVALQNRPYRSTPPPPTSSAAASTMWKLYWCQAQSVLMNPEIWEAKLVQRQKSIFQAIGTAPTSSPAHACACTHTHTGQRSECVSVCRVCASVS